MKIILNCTSLISSGGFVSTYNILSELIEDSRGHDYLAILPEGVGYEKLDISNVNHLTIYYYKRSKFNNLKRIVFDNFTLKNIIREWNADVVFSMGNLGPIKLNIPHALMIRKPYFAYREDYIYGNWSKLGKMILEFQYYLSKKVASNCELISVQTPVMKKRISENFSIDHNRIKIIPNALIKENLVKPSLENNKFYYLKDSKSKNVLALAQYYPHKNLEILLDVAEKLKSKNNKEFKFYLTIDKKQHKNVTKLLSAIKERKLEDVVINLGIVDKSDLSSLYQNVDYLIMPTYLETFGNPYIEAMYNKVLILASDFDFSRAVCKEAAIYFDTFNPEDVIEKLIYAKNEDHKKRLEIGKEIVECSFSNWEEITNSYILELENITKNKTEVAQL